MNDGAEGVESVTGNGGDIHITTHCGCTVTIRAFYGEAKVYTSLRADGGPGCSRVDVSIQSWSTSGTPSGSSPVPF